MTGVLYESAVLFSLEEPQKHGISLIPHPLKKLHEFISFIILFMSLF